MTELRGPPKKVFVKVDETSDPAEVAKLLTKELELTEPVETDE